MPPKVKVTAKAKAKAKAKTDNYKKCKKNTDCDSKCCNVVCHPGQYCRPVTLDYKGLFWEGPKWISEPKKSKISILKKIYETHSLNSVKVNNMYEQFVKNSTEYLKKLSTNELVFIRRYTDTSDNINTILRSSSKIGEMFNDIVKQMANILVNAPKTKTLWVWRGTGLSDIISIKRGSEILDKGFLSATTNKVVAEDFGSHILFIKTSSKVPKVYIRGVSSHPTENEVLFAPGTKLKVYGVMEELLGKRIIFCKVVESNKIYPSFSKNIESNMMKSYDKAFEFISKHKGYKIDDNISLVSSKTPMFNFIENSYKSYINYSNEGKIVVKMIGIKGKEFINTMVTNVLYGQAIGDALGSTFEFMTQKDIEKFLKKKKVGAYLDMMGTIPKLNNVSWHIAPGQITDDTEMAFALCYSIMKAKGEYSTKCSINSYIKWYKSDPFDIGKATEGAISKHINHKKIPETYPSNGSLMRIAPIACFAYGHKPKELYALADVESRLTHNNDIAADACGVFCVAIARGIIGGTIDEMFDEARKVAKTNEIKKALARSLTEKPNADGTNPDIWNEEGHIGSVLLTFQMAFWALNVLKKKKDTSMVLKEVVTAGGDTDTNGAVAGALIGAQYLYPLSFKYKTILDTFNMKKSPTPRPEIYSPKQIKLYGNIYKYDYDNYMKRFGKTKTF